MKRIFGIIYFMKEFEQKSATEKENEYRDQSIIRLFYKRQYGLSEGECDQLHMHFSPMRVPEGLSEQEIQNILHHTKG